MGKITLGAFEVGGGFNIKNPVPPDSRMTVEYYNDLTLDSNADGTLKNQNLYAGMIVYVLENNKHYKWNGSSRTSEDNWEKVGGVIQESTIFIIEPDGRRQKDIANKFNAKPLFFIADISSVYLRVILKDTQTTKLYRIMSSPEHKPSKVISGNFGTGGQQITYHNLELVRQEIQASAEELEQAPGTVTKNFGDIGATTIVQHVNNLTSNLFLNDSATTLTVLKKEGTNTTNTSYRYIGSGGNYGSGNDTLTEDDLDLLEQQSEVDSSVKPKAITLSAVTVEVTNSYNQLFATAVNNRSKFTIPVGGFAVLSLPVIQENRILYATIAGSKKADGNFGTGGKSVNDYDIILLGERSLNPAPLYKTLNVANEIDMSNQMVTHYNWNNPTNEIQFNLINQVKGGIAIIRANNNTTGQPETVNINGETTRRICSTDNWFDGKNMEIYIHQYGSGVNDYEWWYNKKQR